MRCGMVRYDAVCCVVERYDVVWYEMVCYSVILYGFAMLCYIKPVQQHTSSRPKIPEQGLHVVEHISILFVHWLVDVEHYGFPRNPSILLYNEKIEKLIYR